MDTLDWVQHGFGGGGDSTAALGDDAAHPIAVSFFAPPPAAMQINSTAQIRAAIANDVSADSEVQWSVTCATCQCGSFNPATAFSEGRIHPHRAACPASRQHGDRPRDLHDVSHQVHLHHHRHHSGSSHAGQRNLRLPALRSGRPSGSYSTSPDGNLQISINVAQYGTETLNGVLALPAREFVANLFGSVDNGTLAAQTAIGAPSGG